MIKVTNKNGFTLDFDTAVEYMDDSICDYISRHEDDIVLLTEQDYFTFYEYAHERVFGEEWELSKANPCC